MEQTFLRRLNADIRRLVEEIEAFAGTEIEVRPAPAPTRPGEREPKAAVLIASEHRATLLCRTDQEPPPQAVLHELLHLQRYWVERVPQFVPAADPDGEKTKIAHEVENALEHLIIIPREAGYGFNPYPAWNERARANWGAYPWPAVTEAWARRKHGLLSYLTTSFLVTDAQLKRLADEALAAERLLLEAQKFSQRITRVLTSKERCLSTAVRFLRIPREDAAMAYLDIKQRKLSHQPLPWR